MILRTSTNHLAGGLLLPGGDPTKIVADSANPLFSGESYDATVIQ